MKKFSDRLGVTIAAIEIQVESINDDLRNSLWNLLVSELEGMGQWYSVLKELFVGYYKIPIDSLPRSNEGAREWLLKTFMESPWYEAYNLVEFVLENIHSLNHRNTSEAFEKESNIVLETELSGFRAIKGQLVPITNSMEIESIAQAASISSSLGLEGVSQHMNNALRLLGKKPDPDYANSIKESISAIEGICKLLTKEKSGGLEKALTKLSSATPIHPALRNGFANLYGYASDEDGIRHPILESSQVGFAEAKYMLVTCSAFVNFIIDKGRQAKLL